MCFFCKIQLGLTETTTNGSQAPAPAPVAFTRGINITTPTFSRVRSIDTEDRCSSYTSWKFPSQLQILRREQSQSQCTCRSRLHHVHRNHIHPICGIWEAPSHKRHGACLNHPSPLERCKVLPQHIASWVDHGIAVCMYNMWCMYLLCMWPCSGVGIPYFICLLPSLLKFL